MRTFLSYFVKPEILSKCTTGKQLLRVDLKDENLLSNDHLFVGSAASKVIAKLGKSHPDVVSFLEKAKLAYKKCGEYIQKKLPLENKLLKAFSALDPLFVCTPNELVLGRLLSIPQLVQNILTKEEEELYEKEIRSLLIDSKLPPALDDEGKEVDCLLWWISISTIYPNVFKMVSAVLSIFHGPRVESSFNVMGDILDKNSGRTNMTTYSAIQSIKYSLQARQPLAKNRSVSMFSRKDRLYSPVDSKLTRNMRNAYELNNIEQEKKRDELQKRKELFEIDTNERITRDKLKENNSANAEAAKLEHAKILQLAYTPKRKLDADGSSGIESKKKCSENEDSQAGPSTASVLPTEDEEVQIVSMESAANLKTTKKLKKKRQGTLNCYISEKK